MLIPITADGGILPHLRCAPVYAPWAAAAARGAARISAGLGALGAVAALLAGCARDAEPRTFAVPAAAAARIRMVCPPDSFVGAMTVNCPQPLPRRPPADQ